MTKRIYSISTFGFGGEVVMGTVSKQSYEYFEKNSIDLSEYSADSDNCQDVPEDFQPFAPGAWYECENIFHECSTELCDRSYVLVEDENGNEVWKSCLTSSELEESNCELDCTQEVYANEQELGSIIFFGRSFEKGSFFTGQIEITSEFNPRLLKLFYVDVEGIELLDRIEYDGVEIDDSHESSTMTKGSHFEFIPN